MQRAGTASAIIRGGVEPVLVELDMPGYRYVD
jgi:hypothetical protein